MKSIVKANKKTVDGQDKIFIKYRVNDKLDFTEFDFDNYFYIKENDFDFELLNMYPNIFKSFKLEEKSNGNFFKICLTNEYKRYSAIELLTNNSIEVFEGDIQPFKRWLIDHPNIDLNVSGYKKVWLDIETFDLYPLEKDFKGNVVANYPILSIAFKDCETGETTFFENQAREALLKYDFTSEQVLKNEDIKELIARKLLDYEKLLLYDIYEHMINYDVGLAYNGSAFDFKYIQERMKFHELDYYKMMINDIDYMEVCKKNIGENLNSYSLQNVSLHVLKKEIEDPNSKLKNIEEVTKLDWKEITGLKKYTQLYLFEPVIFKAYNIQDVNLMDLIENKLKLLKIQEKESELAMCPLPATLHNSAICDYLMLREYKKLNIVKQSKPSKETVELRKDPVTGEFPPGGYTYCRLPGLHKKVHCFDFKSQYPTNAITYNISPETYRKTEEVRSVWLQDVFSKSEWELVRFAINSKAEFTNAKGMLKKNTYDKAIEKEQKRLGVEHSMEELMWIFTDKYEPTQVSQYCKENDFVFTPADLNYDTRGWSLHPHFLFTRVEGVAPRIYKELLFERDKVKYKLKKEFKEGTPEYDEANWYQSAIKTVANSLYGYFAFKPGREFQYEIPTAITSSSRWTTKKCVLFAKKNGYESTHGDTDSAYIKNITGEFKLKELENMYFEYFNQLVKLYNTFCEIELKNPINETEICNHFIVFEHEKTLDSVIVVKKKRYYFKETFEDVTKYKTQGGAYKKTDTIKIAADYQKELCKDILDFNFDKEAWKQKILELKNTVFDYKLEKDYLIKRAAISRPLKDYGQPVIDGKTGRQKCRKSDGELMFSPIPAHVKLAKVMEAEGKEIVIGDKIEYIILKSPPIEAISIKEFEENPRYDINYYWQRISSVLIEILGTVYSEEVYSYYAECWGYTTKQLVRLMENMRKDDE